MKRRIQRRLLTEESTASGMTPMIDIVFLLLIFFVVTLRQEDILSAPDMTQASTQRIIDVPTMMELTIHVGREGWSVGGRRVGDEMLDTKLAEVAAQRKDMPIHVICAEDSKHEFLVRLLDMCSKHGLSHIALMRT